MLALHTRWYSFTPPQWPNMPPPLTVRDTKRGIDASAKTFSYDPGRSRKGLPSIEEAKDFVESFRPWELFGAQGVTVDPGVRPALDSATTV